LHNRLLESGDDPAPIQPTQSTTRLFRSQ
jgi:hypothetical protein